MNINRNNYELYMIDYLDGQLDAVVVSELLLFVEQNPDIKQEFALLEKTNLIADKEEVFDKSILKKPTYNEVKYHYQEKLIASLEGDLGIFDQYKLEQSFVVYPELKKEADFFNKTKLQPDLTIVFPQKKRLRKGANILSLSINDAWKVAAVLIAFALIVFFIRLPQQQSTSVNTIVSQLPLGNEKQIAASDKEHSLANEEFKRVLIKNNQRQEKSLIPTNLKQNLAQIRNNQIDLKTIESMYHAPIKNMQLNNLLATAVSIYIPTPILYSEEDDSYKNLTQLANDKITKDVLVEKNRPDSLQDKHLLSNMGLLLVKLYNKATGDSAKVVRQYGNDGNLTRVTIVADNFEFSTRK